MARAKGRLCVDTPSLAESFLSLRAAHQAAAEADGAHVAHPCAGQVMHTGPHPPSSLWTLCSWRAEFVRPPGTHEVLGTHLLHVCQGTSLASTCSSQARVFGAGL